jgi:hypothetical protein
VMRRRHQQLLAHSHDLQLRKLTGSASIDFVAVHNQGLGDHWARSRVKAARLQKEDASVPRARTRAAQRTALGKKYEDPKVGLAPQ